VTEYLVVLFVGLSLGIEHARPVTSLGVSLVVDIHLNLHDLALCLHGESRHTDRVEESTNDLSETGWAP